MVRVLWRLGGLVCRRLGGTAGGSVLFFGLARIKEKDVATECMLGVLSSRGLLSFHLIKKYIRSFTWERPQSYIGTVSITDIQKNKMKMKIE